MSSLRSFPMINGMHGIVVIVAVVNATKTTFRGTACDGDGTGGGGGGGGGSCG